VQFLNSLLAIPAVGILAGLSVLATLVIFLLSLISRRLHDIGNNKVRFSGNVLFPFVFDPLRIFKKGDANENIYGKPPKPGIDWKGLFGF